MLPWIDIPLSAYLLALFGTFCLGMAKTGLPGLALINVVIMAELFAKESVGIVLPLLILCDFTVYPLYRKFASWAAIRPLLMPTFIGILAGYLVLKRVDDATAKVLIGITILAMAVLQQIREWRGDWLRGLPDSRAFLIASGLVIGTSTTIANAAGPVYAAWALVHRLPKEDFLGIGARLFLLLNLIKIPFNIDAGILSVRTLQIDLALAPAALLGIWAGRHIVMRIPQRAFDAILLVFSLIGALWLIIA